MKKVNNNILKFCTIIISFLLLSSNINAEETLKSGIAQIGNKVYETLEQAVANAKEGDTITLISDIDTTTYMTTSDDDNVVLEFKKNMTLDLNKHTINTNNMDLIYTGINLTIKNGYFTSKGSYALFIGDEVETDNVLIENVKTKGGLNIYNATNINLKDVDSIGQNYYSVWADYGAQVTILSGNYSTKGNYVLGITKSVESGSYIHIMNGNFVTTNNNLVLPSPYQPPIVYGGIFDTDPTGYKAENAKVRTIENEKYEVYFEKEIDVTPIDEEKTVEKVEIGNVDKENTINVLDKAFKKLNILDKNSKVIINNEMAEPDEEIQDKIINCVKNISNDAKIVSYFDINISVIDTDNNNVLYSITDLDEKIKFKVLIPDELLNNDKNVTRKYYIIRKHEDIIDILETSLSESGKSLEFSSDKFSIYALAYVDELNKIEEKPSDKEETIKIPNTFDGITSYIIMFVISIVGLIVSVINLKKKKIKN